MVPQILIANQMGRLFFRCFTVAGAPYQTLKPNQITSGNVHRRQIQAAGGNWISADHLGVPWPELVACTDDYRLLPGQFIQWYDDNGRKNLYSIDVADTHVTTLWDTDAIRLNLGADISIIFVPCVHLIVPEAI